MTDIKILPQETQLSQEGIISVAKQDLLTVTPPTGIRITTKINGYILWIPKNINQKNSRR